ncbi:transposase [Allorhodopirellula solitaria]|uniref:Transposase IS200 like protein n=1 Tax=Allorhodopirellula solitaria TaxID=2527987 RepID=A0A5C5XRI3_9BACT|nr:transposase [Allorhodopirellula solitaria]TWT64675.1 Transposase IS200 like protein [Allorhodopirellula solitaria]
MPKPIYVLENTRPAYHLRYTWTGWPAGGSAFPSQPDDDFFRQLDEQWATDNLKHLSTAWERSQVQLGFSAIPTVSPVLCVSRAKGRLQHALRLARNTVKFSRKVAFRGIGANHTAEVEEYVSQQVDREKFVDPRFAAMLKRFTTLDSSVALDQPSESISGRYWYDVHIVLVTSNRVRYRRQRDFEALDRSLVATAKKHHHRLAARAWMPDHLHVAMRGNIEESPAEIALAIMNNTAYTMGQNAIWQHGFYAGTFSEYDVRALRR